MTCPVYREPNFDVWAQPHGLVAFATDDAGKILRGVGCSLKPPHWGLWLGNINVSALSPDMSEHDLLALLMRAQEALRCKEGTSDGVLVQDVMNQT